MKNSLGRRLAAIAGAGTVALAGLAAVGAANAAPISQLDSSQTAKVTFHKLTGNPANGTAADSLEKSDLPAGAFPVAGVQFSLTKVQCNGAAPDLNTKAGWDAISGVGIQVTDAGKDTESVSLTGGTNCVESADVTTFDATNDSGVSTKSGLDKTLYVVRELKNDSIKLTDTGKVAPFLLTVPYALASGGWNYDIHIYPKNQLKTDEPTKTPVAGTVDIALPDTADSNQDGTVDWAIKVPVPQKDKYQAFYIKDPLAAALSYKAVTAKVDKKIGADVDPATVTAYLADSCQVTGTGEEATPYKMECTTEATAENSQGKAIYIVLDPTVAKDLKPGDVVEVTLTTGIDYEKITGDAKALENKSATYGINNDATAGSETGIPKTDDTNNPDPQVNYGIFNITKVNKVKTADTLKGAEFELYAVDTKSGVDTEVADGETVKLTKVTSLDTAALTTGDNGKFAKDVKVVLGTGNDQAETFYLKEITAPEGFQTPTGTAAFTKVEFTAGATTNPTITNTQQKLDSNAGLPLTGAQGLLVLSLGGAALIGLGVFAVVVIRRRQQQED